MDDAKEEIRARLPVEDVVGQYIELKRAGRSLKGRSPWGVDKTPSFMVSPEKGIWHDFSSNKGGDIFTFVMEVEGISFREALEKLAAQAGVELQKYSGGDRAVAERKRRAREALELSCKYYQFCLTKNKAIIEYVMGRRGMQKGTIQEFRIGYAPNTGKALLTFLTSRGYKKEELEAAGLLNRFGGDLFRGRMMVPFIDTNGVIGYTARVIDQGEPKYLNTPETLLFNKSRFIFGLAQAKEAIRQNNFVVIVEGNMDVISSHQAGVKEAVATSGTAMTELHLKSLSRLTPDVRLAYDGDAAGVKATERAIMMAGDLGVNLSVISDYHGAKDPDELIQKDPLLWREAVKNYRPAVDWLLDKYEENLDLNSGAGKREYSSIALKLLRYVSDAVERKHYEQLVARKLDCAVEDLREKDAKMLMKSSPQRLKNVSTKEAQGKVDLIRKLGDMLQALIIYGGVENKFGLDVTEDSLKRGELEMVFQREYGGGASEGADAGSGGVATRGRLTKEELEREAEAIFARYKIEMNKQRIRGLQEKLEECADDEEKTQAILREIAALKVK